MGDRQKTKGKLMHESAEKRQIAAELETSYTEHIQNEEVLKKSEEALLSLINATKETLILIDREGMVLLANEVVAQRLGTNVEELIGSCLYNYFPPNVKETRKEQFDKVYLTGEPVNFIDARTEKCFETHCYPVFDKEGKVSRLAIFARDITAQKKIEKELLESEERYRVAIENSNDGVALLKGNQHIYVNSKFMEIFGYDSTEDIIGKTHSLVVHPDDLSMVVEYNRRRQIGESAPSKYEFRGVRKDGKVINVEIFDAKTTYLGEPATLVYLRDVTDRNKAEDALRESEVRYRLISENMMDVICLHDPDSRYVYVSPSLKTVLGYSPEEVLGRSPYDFLEPDVREQMLVPSHQKVTHDKIPDVTLYKTRKKDGSYIWLETKIKPILAPDGTLRYILSASRDVTEREQVEDALKLSEEKFRNIFENAVMGIFQTTPGGIYLSVNPAGARMYGYDSPEYMVKSITDMSNQVYVNPADRIRFKVALADKGYIEGFESEHYRKDRSKIWTSMNARVICDTSGNILYYETTSEDITERKRLESQLRQSQKMEAVGTLAGGIAHDFNNILSAIMGYTNLLQMKMAKDEPLSSYLKQILLSTEKAASLTQSLLAFSRKQLINPRPLDLNEAVTKSGKLLSRLITEDIELKIVLEPENMIIMADSGQIDQIILNLVTNARDAMPNGGILTISTKKVYLDTKFKSIHGFGATGNYAVISIADTGTGIDTKTREKIFEPFFTTKEVGKGTGLGLSIIYGIVQQHNGFVDVSSEPDHGTTFVVYFPLTEKEMGKKTEPQKTILLRGTETVLLAEDNTELRNLTKTVLEDSGYTVIEAVDGEDAVTKFLVNMPDFIILDVVMPKKNGKEVYDKIKLKNQDIKILFTSGYTDDIIYQKGIIEEGLNFIPKPFSPYDLLRTIRVILDKK
jgi:PAS domain S-box-containing protein